MAFGYVKVGAYTPKIKVADTLFNTKNIMQGVDEAIDVGVHVLAFPELCITGYTAGDLFYSSTLLDSALNSLIEISNYSVGKNLVIFVGLPFSFNGRVYNVCAGIFNGKVLGLVPKNYLPDCSEFFEKRYFAPADDKLYYVNLNQDNINVPFGKNVIFADKTNCAFKIAVELCEDLWTAVPPSIYHSVNGARIIVNLSASPENSGNPEKRKLLVQNHSQKIVCAYLYANAGEGESTTDCVFSGHNIIAEKGNVLAQSTPFTNGLITADVDLDAIDFERGKVFNQQFDLKDKQYHTAEFSVNTANFHTTRTYDKTPFIKQGEEEFLIDIAARGLKKRMEHTGAKTLVLGLSGGLDSTLALITAVRATKYANKSLKEVIAITMPCFGTTSRTFDNSVKIAKAFGVTLKKIEIGKSVTRHLKDLKHPIEVHDAAYENAQARERTQVLMDYANMCGGIVVGTGDLSELALGWATYNGDHMSMYAVNSSIPKTLVRHLVNHVANNSKGKLKAVLLDVLDTPVSPELIPSESDKIGQVTEDIVGPYVLHDFFLYNFIVNGFTPDKIYHVAVNSFKGEFDSQTILKWLKTFIRRFFSQQFKRSCLPDGAKVTEISLSPRGSYRMPSDAVSQLWLDCLEKL